MDSVLGGTRAAAAFQTLASLAKRVETQTGTSWTEDYGTFVAVKRLWDRVFPLLAPTPSKELQEKMAEVSPDKWPKEPEPLTLQEDLTGPNKPDYSRGVLGALLGREPAEPLSPEEAAARAETERNVAAWAEYQREIQPLRSKLQQLGDHFRLLEDIGEGVAKDAVPELRRRRSKED